MSLDKYQSMRDFGSTPEPRGKTRRSKGSSFVVQEHEATRHHYDFRLEMNGVLKSWACPKSPRIEPGEKRLAVQTEDHPLEYGSFQGSIPKGHYGAGEVRIWDAGTWTPDGDPDAGLKKGHLRFVLEGDKMHGPFSLVRMKDRGKKTEWLLLKHEDEAPPVTTKKTEKKAAKAARGVRIVPAKGKPPMQLATLVTEPPSGDVLFEAKYDGYRAFAEKRGDAVRLVSRNGLEFEGFDEIRAAIAELGPEQLVLDGELCAIDGTGKTRFELLQGRGAAKAELVYFVFDLLGVEGRDARPLPLSERKELLADLLPGKRGGVLRRAVTLAKDGKTAFAEACRDGLEGIVAKRSDRPYVAGRSLDWQKVKCDARQELVVVGLTRGNGAREKLGALLLGVHDGKKLRYAGKVGTGLSVKLVDDLADRLRAIEIDEAPVVDPPRIAGATWVRPDVVVEVRFTEWTRDGKLRHPALLGVRPDKNASDVVRETPKKTKSADKKTKKGKKTKSAGENTRKGKNAGKEGQARPGGVRLTHPERVLDEATGTTKLALAEYYAAVAAHMLPFAKDRVLSFLRCPENTGDCFVQKHATPGFPEPLQRTRAAGEEHVHLSTVEGVIALAQVSVLEVHGWGARIDDIEHPDWIVIDLDPGPGVSFAMVVEAARITREKLRAIGLESFVKTTGGKGLHVTAPIERVHEWPIVKQLAELVARSLEDDDPKRFTSTVSKSEREGRIFVDYLRNGRGATAVLPYSPRARPGLTVSMPVAWERLGKVDPGQFTVATVPKLLAKARSDPWAALWKVKQRIRAKKIAGLAGEDARGHVPRS